LKKQYSNLIENTESGYSINMHLWVLQINFYLALGHIAPQDLAALCTQR